MHPRALFSTLVIFSHPAASFSPRGNVLDVSKTLVMLPSSHRKLPPAAAPALQGMLTLQTAVAFLSDVTPQAQATSSVSVSRVVSS